ncbi:hypothetical protein BDQ12DRAFT_672537 [Crucibulum laeve]|uniref:Uncharacterized protein n=1 Tax=Crucibulum laeve TaxID=68775 RepID=A0A5C3MIJ5_9AGAR|nr:hypothetical protein BDQ12DRAFT_672537 [Crucibulum laeve]
MLSLIPFPAAYSPFNPSLFVPRFLFPFMYKFLSIFVLSFHQTNSSLVFIPVLFPFEIKVVLYHHRKILYTTTVSLVFLYVRFFAFSDFHLVISFW